MSTNRYGSIISDIEQFVKQAHDKSAADLGGDMGDKETSHPSKSVDNKEQRAQEGFRGSEYDADVQKAVDGVSTNDYSGATEEAKPVSTTSAAATGEDPKNETGSVKFDKEDPGTSHPAEMNGTENGKSANFDEAIKQHGASKVASMIADLILEDTNEDVKQAAEAGAAAAEGDLAAQAVPDIIANLDKSASYLANELAEYFHGFEEGAKKQAMEEGLPGEVGGEGALPEEDLAQLASIAGGEEGGVDPMAEEAMMAEAMGGMGGEMGGMGGEMGGEPSEEEVIEALSMALEEAGVTPEELVMAIEASSAGAEGMPLEEKMAGINTSKQACHAVNQYRNLKSLGRIKNTKRASVDMVYALYQDIKKTVKQAKVAAAKCNKSKVAKKS